MSFFPLDAKIRRLKDVSLFAGASRSRLNNLAAHTDQIDVSAGSVLVREGRPGHAFYIVVEGCAEAASEGRVVASFGPGDFFGEISMIDRDPAVATVTATTRCSLLVLGHDQFRRALQSDPDLEVTVTLAMRRRLRAHAAAGFNVRRSPR